jgi:tetratricopeptide (TPR) repeat protein
VLAALTSGIRQAIGAFLVCMVTLVLGYILLLPASVFLDDNGTRTLEWLATFAALAVLWILYGRRHGRRAALVLVGVVLAGGAWLFVAQREDSTAAQQQMMKISQGDLDAASNELERFYALNRAAKNALKEGNVEKAASLANELAQLAPKYTDSWNYGNAIQDANQVLGQIALSNGDVAEASRRLLASADSKGSPQMNSFGPNMQLAKALLEKGERDVVIEYFNRCSTFWTMGRKELARWTASVRSGKNPDFGANLDY